MSVLMSQPQEEHAIRTIDLWIANELERDESIMIEDPVEMEEPEELEDPKPGFVDSIMKMFRSR